MLDSSEDGTAGLPLLSNLLFNSYKMNLSPLVENSCSLVAEENVLSECVPIPRPTSTLDWMDGVALDLDVIGLSRSREPRWFGGPAKRQRTRVPGRDLWPPLDRHRHRKHGASSTLCHRAICPEESPINES